MVMRGPKTTRDLSDKHEAYVAQLLGGRMTKASGAQFNDQMDGRHDDGKWRFAWDGKATNRASITVSTSMWWKAVEQSHDARPLIPLRFYEDEALKRQPLDLVVADLNDLAEMIGELRG